jgi:hypothetical protein
MSLAAFRARALRFVISSRLERLRPNLRLLPSIPPTLVVHSMPDVKRRLEEARKALQSIRDAAIAELRRDWPGLPDPAVPLDAVTSAVCALVALPTIRPMPGGPVDESIFIDAERRCFEALFILPDAAAAACVRALVDTAGRVQALPAFLPDSAAFEARETAARRTVLADELSAATDLARAAGLDEALPFAEWDRLVRQFDAQLRRLLPLRYGDGALAEYQGTARELCRRIEGILRRLEGAPRAEPPHVGALLDGEAQIRSARLSFAAADADGLRRQLVNQYRQTRSRTLAAYEEAVSNAFQRCVDCFGGDLPIATATPHFRPIAGALSSVGQIFRGVGLGALWERIDVGATFRLEEQSYSAPLAAEACHRWGARLVHRALQGELTEDDIRQTWEVQRLRDSLHMAGELIRGLTGENALAYRSAAAAPNSAPSHASTPASSQDSNGELDDEFTREILATVRWLRAQDPALRITQAMIANRVVCSLRSVKGRTPSLLRQGKLIRTRRLGFSLPGLPGANPDGA